MQRRIFISMVGSALVCNDLYASENDIPKTIKIIVPATPGSSTDAFARIISVLLSEKTGSVVVVENKPGASSLIGSSFVSKSAKDGSVLLINSTSLLTATALMENPIVDVNKDLTPISIIEINPLVVAVSNNSGIKNLSDLIEKARRNPGEISHGTLGVGTIANFAEEKLSSIAKLKFKNIPYKGTSLAVTDMAGGVIDMVIATHSSVSPAIKSGRAKIIGVTSIKENTSFPGIPTVASVAPGFSVDLMLILFAPSGTPQSIVNKYNSIFHDLSNHEKLKEMMSFDGGQSLHMTPGDLKEYVKKEYFNFKSASK